MNARDKWLASFASENTRHTYAIILDDFWLWAESHYSPPRGMDPFDWLVDQRRVEIVNSRVAHRVPRHCGFFVSADLHFCGEFFLPFSSPRRCGRSPLTFLLIRHEGFPHERP